MRGTVSYTHLEAASGVEFIKMEMGVPGLPPSTVGVQAEVEALQNGIASLYPDINGLPALKEEAARFIKAFINVDVAPEGCVPVTGSMQGTFASFLTCSPVSYTHLDVYKRQNQT